MKLPKVFNKNLDFQCRKLRAQLDEVVKANKHLQSTIKELQHSTGMRQDDHFGE